MVAAREAGVIDQININIISVSPIDRNKEIATANPIGKIPTLVLSDGRAVFDSRVICEYLHGLSKSSTLFPADADARLAAQTLHALGDGILDASLLKRYETLMRPSHLQWDQWTKGQAEKITASLDYLEQRCDELVQTPVNIGHVAIGCALGYIEFRSILADWKTGHSRLVDWYGQFSARASMKATEPS